MFHIHVFYLYSLMTNFYFIHESNLFTKFHTAVCLHSCKIYDINYIAEHSYT